ncbi:MAG TPA: ABC transporter permease [Firmicutes bacterium]|nr:ABC transporter permease [Bacillota bacterium]
MWSIIQQVAPYAVAYSIPLLITALGGLYSERSGVVNIGLEGLMVIGLFTSAFVIAQLEAVMPGVAIWIGLLAAVIAGALFSLLHAFASINLNANQVISGTAINMMAGAITVYLARHITGSGNIHIVHGLIRRDIPGLSKIPVLGRLFFTQTYATTWLVLGILLVSWFVLYKTSFGLRLRACGEHPQAADAAGINVYRLRYIAVLISGACAGLGGAVILVTYSGEFNGTVSGLGFLALAALIFGQWKPLGILGATFFFGLASTIANVSQAIPALAKIPGLLLKNFPYIVTLLVLVIFSKSSQAPRAAGEPYDKGKR